MNKFFFKLIIIVCGTCCLQSCWSLHHTNIVNVPMIENEDDKKISVGVNLNEMNNYNIQFASGIDKETAFMINWFSKDFKQEEGRSTFNYGEVAYGRYYYSKRNYPFEIYLGIGYGEGERIIPNSNPKIDYSYLKPFLQFNQTLNKNKNFFLGIKLGTLHYNIKKSEGEFDKFGTYKRYGWLYSDIEENPNKVFIEPVLSNRFGFDVLKFQWQLGLTFYYPKTEPNINFNIGMILDL